MKKKRIALVILLLFFTTLLVGVYKYINFTKNFAVTDAMFIRSDYISNLSFKRVKGRIDAIYFKEGDFVKKGELLASIDPVDYKNSLSQLSKQIEGLNKEYERVIIQKSRLDKQLKLKRENSVKSTEYFADKIKALDYNIKEVESSIIQLKKDYQRYKNLYEKKAVAKRDYEKIETELKVYESKRNALEFEKRSIQKKLEIELKSIKIVEEDFKQVSEITKSAENIQKQIELLDEKYKDLQNSISYCQIYAPFSGKIGKKFVETGMNVASGYPILSLVGNEFLYVEVWLEETKLKGIEIGSKAYFSVDSYPDIHYEGEVEKIYPATAATYALVPRDISAGEFTKVAQRVMLRVKILKGDKSILLSGMGGEIKISRRK